MKALRRRPRTPVSVRPHANPHKHCERHDNQPELRMHIHPLVDPYHTEPRWDFISGRGGDAEKGVDQEPRREEVPLEHKLVRVADQVAAVPNTVCTRRKRQSLAPRRVTPLYPLSDSPPDDYTHQDECEKGVGERPSIRYHANIGEWLVDDIRKLTSECYEHERPPGGESVRAQHSVPNVAEIRKGKMAEWKH